MRVRAVLGCVLGAVVLAGASASIPVLVAAPAQAAGCTSSTGVTVVVDFKGLGGGVQQVCVTDGGGAKAATLFSAAGFAQTYASREPGFVCRVDGKPASDPCVNASPASAYWSLWWTSGSSTSWTYSSLGVQSLTVPDGGTVAWSWDGEPGDAVPSATPRTGSGGSGTGGSGGGGGSGGSGGGGSTGDGGSGGDGTLPDDPSTPGDESSDDGGAGEDGAAGSRGDSDRRGEKKGDRRDDGRTQDKGRRGAGPTGPGPSPDDGVSITEADTEPTAAEPADGGLPGWVPPVVVLVLLGVGGGAAFVRRRRVSG